MPFEKLWTFVISYAPLVLAPILITDCTYEIQDGDEKLNTVKFTWRHGDI